MNTLTPSWTTSSSVSFCLRIFYVFRLIFKLFLSCLLLKVLGWGQPRWAAASSCSQPGQWPGLTKPTSLSSQWSGALGLSLATSASLHEHGWRINAQTPPHSGSGPTLLPMVLICISLIVSDVEYPFFFFFLSRATPVAFGSSKARGQIGAAVFLPIPQPQQCRIQATSVTYTTAHGNAGSLIHWARPGIEPASS